MECPNCSFQNAPGSPLCVRCRSSLQLAGVDVIPPRAARTLSGRCRQRVGRAGRRAGAGALGYVRALRRPWMRELSWRALAWSVVPGLGHLRVGKRAVGRSLLALWLALLLASGAMLGGQLSWFLAFAAIGVHSLTYSLLLAPLLQRMSLGRRTALGLSVWVAIVCLIYLPFYAAGTRTARVLPVERLAEGLPIRNGDALLYTSAWTRPRAFRRGDLVVFSIERQGGAGMVVHAGIGLDRVIGEPGDRVVFKEGILLVNGVAPPAAQMPLRGTRGIPEMDIVLGAGEYLVLPTSLQWATVGNAQRARENATLAVSRVAESRILGRVFWRATPLTRAGRI